MVYIHLKSLVNLHMSCKILSVHWQTWYLKSSFQQQNSEGVDEHG